MSHAREVLVVAGWEFRRYFKWKDQLIGLGVFLAISVVWAGTVAIAGARGGTVTVALARLELAAPAEGRLRFVPAATDTAAQSALREGAVHGVLSRRPDGGFELLVAKDPRYRTELAALLDEVVRRERLVAAGLADDALPALLAPAALDVRFTDPARERRGRGEKIAAAICIAILLMAVMTSLAYLFTGITGEKQLRVTESVISAIAPQAWIDGKVLGITGYAIASVANLAVGGLIVALAAWLASGFSFPAAAVRPSVLLVLVVFTLLGLLLWNAFFAAVAATIDDPNTSSRSSFLLLPVVPVVLSLAVLRDPDSIVSRALALFPVTSAPALPVRMVLSNPPLLEVLAAAILLAGSIWLTRRVAARVFEIGMLMYGKEPTFGEILRWASSPPRP